jgi:hypothetical protein
MKVGRLGAIGVVLLLGVGIGFAWLQGAATPMLGPDVEPDASGPFAARRLPDNPILVHEMDPALVAEAHRYGYVNVNGPSLIRVPDWAPNRLGEYYLYFAHHKGERIRLAYADRLEGPWTLHPPGALHLRDSGFATEAPETAGLLRSSLDLWNAGTLTEFLALAQVGMAAKRAAEARRKGGLTTSAETRPHIASPEVVVDHDRREIRMYFHGLVERRLQMSRAAVSADGLRFRALPELIAPPYLRVFPKHGMVYGLAMPGLLFRSEDGLTGFQVRRKPLFASNTRHVALLPDGDTLYVFFSRVGDAPERILCSAVDVGPADWNDWTPGRPFEVLRPELPFEGAELPVEASTRGESPVPVRQLRDPAIFAERDRTVLLYSAAGEQSIGMAQLFRRE